MDGTGSESIIESERLRKCLGAFVTGVTVVTTVDEEGQWHGLTANSFTSVSLEPPLVLWNQRVSAPSHEAFRAADRFAINILSASQMDLAQRFARHAADKFAGVPVRPGLSGVPLLQGCSAYVECRVEASYPGGDHVIFLGRVERVEYLRDTRPLAFGNGKYLVTDAYDLGPFPPDLARATSARPDAIRHATRVAEGLALELGRTVGLAVWGNHGPTVVRWEESKCPVRTNLQTGLVLPLLSSATGRVFAAYLPREWTSQLAEQEVISTYPGESIENGCWPRKFEQVIAEIRDHGLARVTRNVVANVNERGINAFSAPIFNSDGLVICALTVMGHSDQMSSDWDQRSALILKERAAALSQELGYRSRSE